MKVLSDRLEAIFYVTAKFNSLQGQEQEQEQSLFSFGPWGLESSNKNNYNVQ